MLTHSGELKRERVCVIGGIQALPVAIDKSLEQRLVVGDGLQSVAIIGHVADGPLTQPSAAQSEDVTVREDPRLVRHKLETKTTQRRVPSDISL